MYRIPGFHFEDHLFRLPLDHDDPAGGAIEVFGREVLSGDGAHRDRPWLVFLQGGPGFESPRPLASGGWLSKAIERYRVLLLDQRGTGRSTPQTPENITAISGAAAQAEHLARFRADAIVRDCEAIREELGVERWTVLGQSFGGFCAVHYLSTAPDGLAGVMITGGLPGLDTGAEDVYRRTYPLTRTKNQQLFERFPELEGRARAVSSWA